MTPQRLGRVRLRVATPSRKPLIATDALDGVREADDDDSILALLPAEEEAA
jgi:hypothetical protein